MSLINIALQANVSFSSFSKWSTKEDYKEILTASHGRDFSFHTEKENNPWVELDLQYEYKIENITIFNRKKTCQDRAYNLMVEISADKNKYEVIHQGFIVFDNSISFNICSMKSARFVRVSTRGFQYLHLYKIEVYIEDSKNAKCCSDIVKNDKHAYIVESTSHFNKNICGNEIISNKDAVKLVNSKIFFKGNKNKLIMQDGATLINTNINFNGDNACVYLSKGIIKITADMHTNCQLFLGRDNYFNGVLYLQCSEERSVFIGDNCLFSFGIMIRTADPHLIYDSCSKRRINHSKSVLVGDHVWIGQNVTILKGSYIGSGSIIGASSVLSNKYIESNTVYAGNPVKKIKENIFWDGACVHNFTKEKTKEFEMMNKEDYIFKRNPLVSDNTFIDLEEASIELIVKSTEHNRFLVVKNNR